MKTIVIVGLGNVGHQYAQTRHNIGFQCLNVFTELVSKCAKRDRISFASSHSPFDLENKIHKKSNDSLVSWNLNKSLQCMMALIPLKDFLAILSYYPFMFPQFKFLCKGLARSNYVNKDDRQKQQEKVHNKILQEQNLHHVFLENIKNLGNDYQILFVAPTTYMNKSGEALQKIHKYYNVVQTIVIYDDLDTRFGSVNFRFKGGSGGHNGLKSIHQHVSQDYLRVKLGIGSNIFLNENGLKAFCKKEALDNGVENLLYEIFRATLESKINFHPSFKTQGFFKVMQSKMRDDSLQTISPEQFNDLIKYFQTFHKGNQREIAHYVLSPFNTYENAVLNGILTYASLVLIGAILDWVNKDKRVINAYNTDLLKAQEFMSLDAFFINFK